MYVPEVGIRSLRNLLTFYMLFSFYRCCFGTLAEMKLTKLGKYQPIFYKVSTPSTLLWLLMICFSEYNEDYIPMDSSGVPTSLASQEDKVSHLLVL